MSNTVLRRFCFTWNNYSNSDLEKVKIFFNNHCKYGIVGEEHAPNTGTPHLQGFSNLLKPMRFSTIKKHLSDTIHIEKANGSDKQNQTYCSKSGTFFEKGEPFSQGQRSDLESVVQRIQEGETNISNIAKDFPLQYIRYHRGIRDYIQKVNPIQPRNFRTKVYYFWGEPGTGKSATALAKAKKINTNSIYYKPRGLWWDGYQQHEVVIIDDYYGWIKYDELLKICDRYPYKVQIKGGFEEFTTKYIFITSNVDTCDLYTFKNYNTQAIERRITKKIHFTEPFLYSTPQSNSWEEYLDHE
ncbi:replication associated protein [Chifec virus UA13_1800]|uniref:Replication-associated protein n=1 Tax=Chifec virus UA13_1800 TaxID=2914455 RepID=A0AAX3A7U6_9CIRC|nr:replication associated protein [Chifec virus UA13_1800]UNY50608.1 replication associated protein [Chifec virus UA13_1800]